MNPFFFTVTNDLSYDQRMIRICSSLAGAGYPVMLVGRKLSTSPPLQQQPFRQKRIYCFFRKGKAFYVEYNIRLFFYLLFKKASLICAIDLDTILPCLLISKIKAVPRVYDAHELFCEMKEVVTRPHIYKIWKLIEKKTVPRFNNGYTVNQPIADEFKKMYKVKYEVIRNTPLLKNLTIPEKKEKYILYQGAVNEGRGFEMLIPAMKEVNAKLIIAGDGNFMAQAKKLVEDNQLTNKIIFTGKLLPDELYQYTLSAYIGITLFENKGQSNYLSLANRFFDYLHAGVPQLCVNYPVYKEINKNCPVGVLIDSLSSDNIFKTLNRMLEDMVLYNELQQNCLIVREKLNWQQEEKKLLAFYKKLFSS